jgi:multimeric flavodoxin WrbA
MRIVYREIQACDSLILASPIFFGSLTGQMKIMIDRFQCVWISHHRLGKALFPRRRRGALLCVSAAHRSAFLSNARSIVKNFYSLINVEYAEELYCSGMDGRGQARNHPHCLRQAFELGWKLVSAGPPG